MRAFRGAAALLVAATSASGEAPGPAALHRLDRLPAFREAVFVGSVSSYDRTSGNDDGFSGTYSFVRKDERGLVLAELQGPGLVTRFWTPTPTDDTLELYFDGEREPRLQLPLRELFTGESAPFLAPLVSMGAGGNTSYVPIPYRQKLEVVLRAETFQFYQINFATYPAGTVIQSWDDATAEPPGGDLERARALWRRAGEDVHSFAAPPGAPVTSRATTALIGPGTTRLFDIVEPGRIVGLRLRPASAFAGKSRSSVLRVTWDGAPAPAIEVPVGDFFGYSFGEPAARSLLVGTSDDTSYIYFPMPFDRSARIEIVETSPRERPVEIEAELFVSPVPRAPDEGKLYALWRREHPTVTGRPFTFVRTRGRGHLVGVFLQAQGPEPGSTSFFEGDDRAVLDGELAAHGTGSEDFFNGGWYDVPGRWESRVSLPMSGCLEYRKHLGRTGGYRLFLADAYAFRESLELTIEHGPTGNAIPTDYTAVSFLYAEAPPESPSLPPSADRNVSETTRAVFTPGWNVPIYASSLRGATLEKRVEEIADEPVRMLSLRATGEDIFGPHHVAFLLDAPAAGRYRVLLEAVRGPAQGQVRLFQNETPLGAAVDLFATERSRSGLLPLGDATLIEGDNVLFFRSAGKHPEASGIDMDLVTIVLERLP